MQPDAKNNAALSSKKQIWAWAFYDFANSGYTTVVITAIFNAYFVSVVANNAVWATFLWTAVLSVSYLLTLLMGPLIGAHSDANCLRKRYLVLTTLLCVGATLCLALFLDQGIFVVCLFLMMSNLFYGLGENIIAAYLPEISSQKSIGRVSGYGWSLGYIGGMITLGLCLFYVTTAENEGYSADIFVPVTLFITAAIYLVAALPSFIFLGSGAGGIGVSGSSKPMRRLLDTFKNRHQHRDLFRFLGCTVFYQAGIQAVIALAAIYAQQVVGFTFSETILLIMVVNLTAALGAFVFGPLQDRFGHIKILTILLLLWICITLLAWLLQSKVEFWIVANLVGISLGASQSAARAIVGLMTPPSRRAEFFGLWGVAVRCSAIIGPLTYGLLTWATDGDYRNAILSLSLFFVVGLFLLRGVDLARGQSLVS